MGYGICVEKRLSIVESKHLQRFKQLHRGKRHEDRPFAASVGKQPCDTIIC